MLLAQFEKSAVDVQDFDVYYTEWLTSLNDTGKSVVCTADAGITLVSSSLVNGVVKVWLSGGTSNHNYKVNTTVTSDGGRVKQATIAVKIV